MAHTITEECINCGACDESCPVNAISEAGDKRVIDAETCIDCGACVPVCPVQAIFPLEELPEKWGPFAKVDADWYAKKK